MTRKITAFAGVQGSGKDYRCQQLLKQGNYKKMAFADALRKIAFTSLGVKVDKGLENYEWMKANGCIRTTFEDGSDVTTKIADILSAKNIREFKNLLYESRKAINEINTHNLGTKIKSELIV